MVLLKLRRCLLYDSFQYLNTMASSEVREAFFSYFKNNGHIYFPSSSLLPFDDPSLLFVNAGMNQFKSIFLGTADPDSELGRLRRVYNSQKCLRAGGRTSDLFDVGRDAVHHSFFEMLGNWSFGEYYKKEACNYAWEFLTSTLGISPARLYVTYFGGDDTLKLKPDMETKHIWQKIGVNEERILPFNSKHNFWYMSDTGPCGTCSEIHYNVESEKHVPERVNADGSSVVEIWNLVFLAYNRDASGSILPLPKHHVDCGMGFERICAIMQNVKSDYDTDIFRPLMDAISKWSERCLDAKTEEAFRVVADHLRACCIVIAEGVMPGGTGRGFVLRQMLRRAAVLSETRLKTGKNLLKELTPCFIEHLAKSFPEVARDSRKIIDVIGTEEAKFWLLVTKGRNLIEEYIALKPNIKEFPGEVSSHLWLSHGIPLDVQKFILEPKKLSVDVAQYEICCEKNREKSLLNQKCDGKDQKLLSAVLDMIGKSGVTATDDSFKYGCKTAGNDYVFGTVLALINEQMEFVEELQSTKYGFVVLSKTSFYAEEGGQACDIGVLCSADKEPLFVVDHVLKHKDVVILSGRCTQKSLKKDVSVAQKVDMERRVSLARNHTATHLLLYALRELFGPVVTQKGSTVLQERLKFSCSVSKPLSLQEVYEVQNLVNKCIDAHQPVVVQELPLSAVLNLRNLQSSLEPYLMKTSSRNIHRVVSINDVAHSDKAYAVECCCGTHVQNTAEVGGFQIVSRKMTGAGICRLEAVTGSKADEALTNAHKLDSRIHSLNPLSIAKELPSIKEEMRLKVLPCVAKDELHRSLKKQLKLLKKERS